MNINPHLQYLQQQQQSQQPMNASVQSPQISQLQLQQQQQLQQQRQQLLNHHLQQQPQQQLGTPNASQVSTNPLLSAINASNQSGGSVNAGAGASSNQTVNTALQLQLQQQLQQHQQQIFQQQLQGQHNHPVQQQQVPIIKEVWSHNLEQEFHALRSFVNDNKTSPVYIAIHQEIPGIVARPVGTFKSSSDYHFQTLRSNSDLLNLIQLSLCVTKVNKNNEIRSSIIWQFNFLYDLTKEMYNEEHLTMLSQTSQINFQLHMTQGIPHFAFAELITESGLLLDTSINWISYHAGYDLGFLISLLINDNLPLDEKDFYWWCSKYFPNFYDLKLIGNQLVNNFSNNNTNSNNSKSNGNSVNNGPSNSVEMPTGGSNSDSSKNMISNNKPSIEYLAEELHLLPISPVIRQYFASSNSHFPGQQHQQMTSTLHAYLSMECFKELLRQSGYDNSILEKFKGVIWGLGSVYGSSTSEVTQQNGSVSNTTPSTPGTSAKSGVVHFGRPL